MTRTIIQLRKNLIFRIVIMYIINVFCLVNWSKKKNSTRTKNKCKNSKTVFFRLIKIKS